MNPARIKPSVIDHQVICYTCRGTGHTHPAHTLGKLIAMMDAENGVDFKINFIKEVRSQWGMGLREAKEVAEAALDFRLAVMEATKPRPTKMECEDERHIFGVGESLVTQKVYTSETGGYDDLQAICECQNAGFSINKVTMLNDEPRPDISDRDLLNGAMYVEEK